MRLFRAAAAAALTLLSFVTFSAFATTLLPLTDRELVERADAVISATVLDGVSLRLPGGAIVTDIHLSIDDVLKGPLALNEVVTVRETGGAFGHVIRFIPSAARYTPGEHVLVFLNHDDDNRWFTSAMSLGKFSYGTDSRGRSVVLRNTEGETEERPRLAREFVSFVRDVADGRTPAAVSYASEFPVSVNAVAKVESAYPASAYTLTPGAHGVRWPGQPAFTVNYGTTGTISGITTSVVGATNAWHSAPGSNISFASGQAPGSDAAVDDGRNTVFFNYSGAQKAGVVCDAKACTELTVNDDGAASHQHTFAGETFYTLLEVDIYFKSGFSFTQAEFDTIATHEFGHAIGLRHSDAGIPGGVAVMQSVTNASFGNNLQQWDKDAVATVYGSGPPCVPAAVTSQSNNVTVNSGAQTTLTVAASGSSPFTYQWYNGQSGDTASPINGATNSSYQTPPLTQTRSFWVKVSNTCGSANSGTITVTVAPCTAPSISVQPAANTTISSGGTVTLNFTPSGTTPLTIQWYAGTTGDSTNPIAGATSQLFTTPALTQQASFWAKVTNNCGSANTNTATVTIAGQCLPPSITAQPKDVTINVGQSPSLTVSTDNAASYQWYLGASGDTTHPISGATSATLSTGPITSAGTTQFWVKVTNSCGSVNSASATVTAKCVAEQLVISVPGAVLSTSSFIVQWNGDAALSTHYELQESASADFSNATTFTITNSASRSFTAKNSAVDTRYYYRVRAFAICGGEAGAYSVPGTVLVTAPPPPSSSNFNFAQPPCNCTLTQNLQIGGVTHNGKVAFETQDTFNVSSDSPFVTVTPSSGTLPADGTTVTVKIDTSSLPVGSTQGTLTITKSTTTPGTNALSSSSTTTSVPVTVSLVSPTTPTAKDAGASNTLLIPAVAHADGVGTQFVSDVRVTNTTARATPYLLSYTPGGTDGTTAGKQMTVTINGGDTLALNDIVKSWFGSGVLGEIGIGSIEIRPLDPNATSHGTVAASRTYASTSTGTFGQFIPALPVANFLGKSSTSFVSLQQIAQSAAFRTNFGFVEGSGQAANVEVRLFNSAATLIDTKTLSLRPFELSQVSFQQLFPNATLQDGRVEARVLSDTGKISAYASVVDNKTNDPLLVLPVDPSKLAATTYVLPGIGDFDIGVAHWKSDVRLYNAGTTAVPATLTYYPQGGGTPRDFTVTVQPGEVRVLDNFIASQFTGVAQTAGSLVASAAANASLVATARTYTDTGNGTYGQFIPGVTATDGVGSGERPLQVLQLEESPSFHTNAGVVELTGNPVHVKVSAFVPDGRTSATVELDLGPYQFLQLNRVFTSMGYGTVYNGRLAVQVTGGTGRVTAYGSNIDNRTQDPTYVPAQ